MSVAVQWRELADALESFLQGQLDAQAISEKYLSRAMSDDVQRIMANVAHFLSDADIRARDPKYKQMQEREMVKLIGLLRAGCNLRDILEITFLGESR